MDFQFNQVLLVCIQTILVMFITLLSIILSRLSICLSVLSISSSLSFSLILLMNMTNYPQVHFSATLSRSPFFFLSILERSEREKKIKEERRRREKEEASIHFNDDDLKWLLFALNSFSWLSNIRSSSRSSVRIMHAQLDASLRRRETLFFLFPFLSLF